jgi:hypothetical protein
MVSSRDKRLACTFFCISTFRIMRAEPDMDVFGSSLMSILPGMLLRNNNNDNNNNNVAIP